MSGIFDIVQQQLKSGALQEIAQHAGIDPATAQQAVNVALPKVLGGMAQHASQANNAQVIHAEADKYSSNAGVLGNLPNVFTGQGEAGGILGKVIGPRHEEIQNGVANATGIDKAKAAKVIGVLAPVVLGAIALKKRQDGMQPHEVQGQLQQALQQAQQRPSSASASGAVAGDTGVGEGPRA